MVRSARSALVVTLGILAYHCYVVSAAKKTDTEEFNKGTRNRDLETDNDVITEVRSTHPTATVVDLKTLLLEESCNSDH